MLLPAGTNRHAVLCTPWNNKQCNSNQQLYYRAERCGVVVISIRPVSKVSHAFPQFLRDRSSGVIFSVPTCHSKGPEFEYRAWVDCCVMFRFVPVSSIKPNSRVLVVLHILESRVWISWRLVILAGFSSFSVSRHILGIPWLIIMGSGSDDWISFGASLQLQSIITAHTLNSFWTSLCDESVTDLRLISTITWIHESTAFYNFHAARIEDTTLNSSSVVTEILYLARCYPVTTRSLLYLLTATWFLSRCSTTDV
jgi:hypothetical protein